ncbi:MAG: hypothetical protein Q8R13_03280 [bacterium]|nr:hypothetical protein [bacterium]
MKTVAITGLAMLLILLVSVAGHAAIIMHDAAPNVGGLDGFQLPQGDGWLFTCPRGGTVSFRVDTTADTLDINQAAASTIDPLAYILDEKGQLVAYADDSDACTYPPVCGYACPAAKVGCGEGERHLLVVRDYGLASDSGTQCTGGGYELHLEVWDAAGRSLPSFKLLLGAGKKTFLPPILREMGVGITPALNNEGVPNASFSSSIGTTLSATSSPHMPEGMEAVKEKAGTLPR